MDRKKALSILSTIASLLLLLCNILHKAGVYNSRANVALLIAICAVWASLALFIRFKLQS